MALTTMYEGMNNSPQTDITAAITASDTVIPVSSVSVFPAAPNLATLGTDENAEVIRYNGISGSTLTGCERGFGGSTASPWPKDTVISRQITKYDLDTLRQNVLDLENRKLEAMDTVPTAGSTKPVQSGGVKTALDNKQDALTFDPEPTADSTNPVTSGGVKSYVDSHDDFKITGTVSSSGYTLTDSRINDEHWEVDWIQFLTSSHVLTGVDWSTDIVNHTVSLSATYSGSTNVVVNMHWVQ